MGQFSNVQQAHRTLTDVLAPYSTLEAPTPLVFEGSSAKVLAFLVDRVYHRRKDDLLTIADQATQIYSDGQNSLRCVAMEQYLDDEVGKEIEQLNVEWPSVVKLHRASAQFRRQQRDTLERTVGLGGISTSLVPSWYSERK